MVGPTEILIILAIGAALFGAKKIPEVARGVGQGFAEWRRTIRGVTQPIEEVKRSIYDAVRLESHQHETGERQKAAPAYDNRSRQGVVRGTAHVWRGGGSAREAEE